MKLTIKIALVISLFCATAFAEGEMGSGGYAGEMGSGGYTCGEMGSGGVCLTADPTDTQENDGNIQRNTRDEDILIFVRNYLADLFW